MRKLILLFLTGTFFLQVSCVNSQENQQKETLVKIETSHGDLTVKLFNQTPAHRDNFIKLANEGFYDGLLFHRVINNFMIQGGDPDSKTARAGQRLGGGDPGYTLPAEIDSSLFHKRGVLAAARRGGPSNPEKRSSGSQFYIVQGKVFTPGALDTLEIKMKITIAPERREAYTTIGGYPSLDQEYTIFGEVVEGLEVLDKIAGVETDQFDRPVTDIKMKVKVLD